MLKDICPNPYFKKKYIKRNVSAHTHILILFFFFWYEIKDDVVLRKYIAIIYGPKNACTCEMVENYGIQNYEFLYNWSF